MSQFKVIAKESDIAPGELKAVHLDGEDLVLANVEGKIYALHNSCPHVGAPLAGGWLEGKKLICPFHGWEFDATNGEGLEPVGADIACYPIKIENGEIYVSL